MGYDIEKEKREAIEAGRRALSSLQTAKENLNSAKNWGLVVLLGLVAERRKKYSRRKKNCAFALQLNMMNIWKELDLQVLKNMNCRV